MDYKLSPNAIAQIVQLIQLGILTGTDVSDQLRTFRLCVDADTNTLVPSPDFLEMYNKNIEKMATEAESLQQ